MKHYVIVVMLSLWLTPGVSQTYNAFPTDSAYWSVNTLDWWSNPNWGDCIWTYHYHMLGDTIIDSLTYSKIYRSQYETGIYEISTATYFAAVREDSLRRVYARAYNNTIEKLLYDFDLDSGEVVCMDFLNLGCHPVYDIDSIFFAGKYRRRTLIYLSEMQEWIEGIGNVYGLFETYYTGTISTGISCFQQGDSLLHGDIQFCHCDDYPGVEEGNSNLTILRLFPNPIGEEVTLRLGELGKGDFSCRIFNAQGNQVRDIKEFNGEIHISSSLVAGLYLVQVWDGNILIGAGRFNKL